MAKNKYYININYETTIEANNEQDAEMLFFSNIEDEGLTMETFISDIIKTTTEKEFFYMPSMCVAKDDLKALFEDKHDKIDRLTDEQMQAIADQMSDYFMNDYSVLLREAIDDLQLL